MRDIGKREQASCSSRRDHVLVEESSSDPDVLQSIPSTTAPKNSVLSITELNRTSESASQARWMQSSIRKVDWHRLTSVELARFVTEFEKMALQDYELGSPRTDQLLTLIQFNVFRAFVSNTASVQFTMDWLKQDATSPWLVKRPEALSSTKCPPDLKPTVLQTTVPHHPWIDLIPVPKIRDNLLLAEGQYDEDELCNVILDFHDVPNEKSGLIVWGEPWDSAGWEISENFLTHWAWVIRGCDEIQRSTNRWRRRRGEKELHFHSGLRS